MIASFGLIYGIKFTVITSHPQWLQANAMEQQLNQGQLKILCLIKVKERTFYIQPTLLFFQLGNTLLISI